MRIHLDRDRLEPLLWEESLVLEGFEHELVVDLGAVACEGRVDVSDAGFLVAADLSYEVRLECTRCLKPMRVPVASRLELRVVTHGADEAGGDGGEVELDEDDVTVLHLAGEVLETAALVAEQVVLEIPMKPLCDPDCRGICPECGADRNEEPECCDGPAPDPRWAGLGEIRARLAGGEPGR